MVDHLGHVGDETTSNSTYERVTLRTARLLEIAKRQKDLALVVMCQFSRDYSKNNRLPVLSDLRDSGAIEQDANSVLLVFREEVRQKAIADNEMLPQDERDDALRKMDKAKGAMEIIIGKNRPTQPGAVTLNHMIGYNSVGKYDT